MIYGYLLVEGNVLMHRYPIMQGQLKILMGVAMKRMKSFDFITNFLKQLFILSICFPSFKLRGRIIVTHFIYQHGLIVVNILWVSTIFSLVLHAPQVKQYLEMSCLIQFPCLKYFNLPSNNCLLFCRRLFLLLYFLSLFCLGLLSTFFSNFANF